MSKNREKIKVLWLVRMRLISMSFFIVLASSVFGCTRIVSIKTIPNIETSTDRKIDLSIALVLPPEYCSYAHVKVTSSLGDKALFPLGSHLCQQSEPLVKSLFSRVEIFTSERSEEIRKYNGILIPHVSSVYFSGLPGWAWSDMEFKIDVEWKLKNQKGEVVWVETISGLGVEEQGNGFAINKHMNILIAESVTNLFRKTRESIVGAEEISRFSKGK